MKRQRNKTQFEKHAEKIKLRAFERRELKERLISYMEYHPITEPVVKRKEKKEYLPSQAFTYINFKSVRLRMMVGTMAAIVVIIVPFVAERSVPGDVLYPVKVRFNEEVREQLSFTGYQKIAWETERVERRIAEARLLASEGRLTDETEAAIGAEVREHARAAQAELAELKLDDADGAAVAEVIFRSALDIQSLVLNEQIARNASTTGNRADGLALALSELISDVEARSGQGSSTPSYVSFVGRVELETTRARELFDAISDTASKEEREEIERRLLDSERAFSKAQEYHEAGEDGRAIAELRIVLSNTQKLIAFMTDIDVRLSIAIEKLIPKTLTDEERYAKVNELVAYIENVESKAAAEIESLDESTAEKATSALQDLARTRAEIEEALSTEGDLTDALDVVEVLLVEAVALAEDIESLFVPKEDVGSGEDEPVSGEFGILDPDASTTTATTTATTTDTIGTTTQPTTTNDTATDTEQVE